MIACDIGWVLSVRVLLLLIFAGALYGKARRFDEFIGIVGAYRVTPAALTRAAAWLILLLEGAVVLIFASGYALVPGAVLAAVLLCVFAGAIAANVRRGVTDLDCGCFRNNLRQPISSLLVRRNLALAALALLPGLSLPAAPSVLQLLNGLGGGVALFLLFEVGERLMAAQRQTELLRTRWSS